MTVETSRAVDDDDNTHQTLSELLFWHLNATRPSEMDCELRESMLENVGTNLNLVNGKSVV